jgi:hypothetical protein
MLFGKVTDFNVRGNLRAPTAPSKSQNPFFLPGFEEIDKLVSSGFLESLPQIYRNNNGVTNAPDGSSLDTDLYMVHIIPHAYVSLLTNFERGSRKTQCNDHSPQPIHRLYRPAKCVNLSLCQFCKMHPRCLLCIICDFLRHNQASSVYNGMPPFFLCSRFTNMRPDHSSLDLLVPCCCCSGSALQVLHRNQ